MPVVCGIYRDISYSCYTGYERLKNWDVFPSGEFGTINPTDEVRNLRVS
jgi:hypothetical protein